MKKVCFTVTVGAVLLTISLQADNFEDGMNAARQKDYQNAARLFSSACNHGKAEGCSALGFLTSEGLGTQKNSNKAAQLFKKGCNGGDAAGCWSLGFLYAVGDGVKKNHELALKYSGKACKMGDRDGCNMYEKIQNLNKEGGS